MRQGGATHKCTETNLKRQRRARGSRSREENEKEVTLPENWSRKRDWTRAGGLSNDLVLGGLHFHCMRARFYVFAIRIMGFIQEKLDEVHAQCFEAL
jgi:hypothetical protein